MLEARESADAVYSSRKIWIKADTYFSRLRYCNTLSCSAEYTCVFYAGSTRQSAPDSERLIRRAYECSI